MTVIERPLFGRVELHREPQYSEWIEQRRNRVVNPHADGFYEWAGGNNYLDAVPVAVGGPDGGSFLRFTLAAGDGYQAAYGALQPSSSYYGSVYVRASVAVNYQINLVPFAGGDYLGGEVFGPVVSLLPGVWTRIHKGMSSLASSTDFALRVRTFGAPAHVLDVTMALVEDGPALRPYFDGGTAALDALSGHAWTAGVNASESIYRTRTYTVRPDFIRDALSVTIRRGGARTGLGIKTDVGIMTFDLLNADDPMQGGPFQPGQEIRAVSRDLAGDYVELFTGRVADVAAAYPMNKGTGQLRAVTRVTVADAVKVHGQTPRYGVTIPAGFETFEARIQRLDGSALAPVEPPVEGAPREVYAL